jgi:hypothetical protein
LLAELVERTLLALQYAFIKSVATNVTEFEISSPSQFIVRVESQPRPQGLFSFGGGARRESAIELVRVIGSREPSEQLERNVSVFLDGLRSEMRVDPWKGLGVFGSRHSRRMWSRLKSV